MKTSLRNARNTNGEAAFLDEYNKGYEKMMANPGYAVLNETLMRYHQIVSAEHANIQDMLSAVKDAVKDKIIAARAIELAFEEIKASGNKESILMPVKDYILIHYMNFQEPN